MVWGFLPFCHCACFGFRHSISAVGASIRTQNPQVPRVLRPITMNMNLDSCIRRCSIASVLLALLAGCAGRAAIYTSNPALR